MSDTLREIPQEQAEQYFSRLSGFFDAQDDRMLFGEESDVLTTSGLSLRVEAEAEPRWSLDVSTTVDEDFGSEQWSVFANEIPTPGTYLAECEDLDSVSLLRAVSVSWDKNDQGDLEEEVSVGLSTVFDLECRPEDMLLYDSTKLETQLVFSALRQLLFDRAPDIHGQSKQVKEFMDGVRSHSQTVQRTTARFLVENSFEDSVFSFELDVCRTTQIAADDAPQTVLSMSVFDEEENSSLEALFSEGKIIHLRRQDATSGERVECDIQEIIDGFLGQGLTGDMERSVDPLAFASLARYIDAYIPITT